MLIRKVKFKANETNPVDTWFLCHLKLGNSNLVYLETPQCSISGKATISQKDAENYFNESFDQTRKALRDIYGDLTITEETI